ncbi:MAG: BMP family ABC transporter substrate-binding protein [Phototrophicales bacterium]|nr:MAG: BMP family ABC transporter substrate-binding protein [Phototrophicales bacterium]
MRVRFAGLLGLVALLGAAFVAPAAAQDALIESVCLVTDVGRVNDGTFNQYAYEGMLAAAEDFDLEVTFIETQAQTDYEANLATCIDEGYDAVITVGFLIADATLAAAEANPDVYFIGVDQFVPEGSPENYVGVQFREDEAGFLVGAMAALMTESGTIAGVYGIDIPPVVKFRNGFEQGARYINPDINVLGVYIDSFTARDRGASAAEQFIGEGADVIFGAGGPTGSGAIAFAASVGALVIGVDQDEYFTTFQGGEAVGAENIITSAVKRVDQSVYLSLEALVNGDLETFGGGGTRVLSAANDGIGFAPSHDANVPEEVIEQVTAILEGLKNGSIETGVDPITGELLETM